MRKLLAALLVAMIVIIPICSLAVSDTEITFRNIPWLSSPSVVREVGFADNESAQWWLSDEVLCDFGTVKSIDNLVQNILETTTPNCFKMGTIMSGDLDVAGYKVSTVLALFAYDIDENGAILSDAQDTKFMAGVYYFDYIDKAANKERAKDLEAKLTGIYGKPSKKEGKIITWLDNDKNKLMLYNDGSSSTMLMYKYHDADELIAKAYEVAKKEVPNPVGNTNGL